jgi:uncharacterized protein YfiM (DUF2279 family)
MKNMIFGAGPPIAMRRRMLILYVFLFSFYVTIDYGFLVMVWHSIILHGQFQTQHQTQHSSQFVSSAGEAVAMTQEVVKTMLAKGYVLSKDALSKAKDFDESHRVSATATAKVSELSQKIGLTDKLSAGYEVVKSVDQKYNVSGTTIAAASATGRTVAAAVNSVVNSSYFSKGALWMSGALTRAAQAASDLGNRGTNQ